ncbi:MAG: hypothetical protein IKK25_00210 [Lentisphaeria bacterium]|nr:hypothetical protein [Lentisphaeria bacterium]
MFRTFLQLPDGLHQILRAAHAAQPPCHGGKHLHTAAADHRLLQNLRPALQLGKQLVTLPPFHRHKGLYQRHRVTPCEAVHEALCLGRSRHAVPEQPDRLSQIAAAAFHGSGQGQLVRVGKFLLQPALQQLRRQRLQGKLRTPGAHRRQQILRIFRQQQAGVLKISQLVEKPSVEEAPGNLAVAARYIYTPEIFEWLKVTKPGKGGEIQLPDATALLMAQGAEVYGKVFEGRRHDIGDKLSFLKATVEFGLRRPEFKEAFASWLSETLRKREEGKNV